MCVEEKVENMHWFQVRCYLNDEGVGSLELHLIVSDPQRLV